MLKYGARVSCSCSFRLPSILKFKALQMIARLLESHGCAPLTAQLWAWKERREKCELSVQQWILVIVDADLTNSYPPTCIKYTTAGSDFPCDVLTSVCPLVLSIWAMSAFPPASWESVSDSSGECTTRLDEIVKVQSHLPSLKELPFFSELNHTWALDLGRGIKWDQGSDTEAMILKSSDTGFGESFHLKGKKRRRDV